MTIEASSSFQKEFVSIGPARLHYLKAGQGRPLVLLHGLVGSAHNWTGNIYSLARHSTVYALDLPNMGESERLTNLDASFEALADSVASFIETLGLGSVDVVAHSHGGAVAMMLAARHPEKVRRLVLFAPANPYCDLGQQLIRFYQTRFGLWLARQIPWIPRPVKWIALRRMYGDPSRLKKDSLDGYIQGLAVPGTIDHIMRILEGWEDGMGRLKTAIEVLVEKPVLLIWGDRDQTVGLHSARRLTERFRHFRLMVISGVGHIPFQEMPDDCNRAMVDWLYKASRA